MDGESLSDVVVLIGPEEGHSSFGDKDENGYFELMYLPEVSGVIIGTHTVSIMPAEEEEEESDSDAKPRMNSILAIDNTESTLTAEVTADGDNEFRFDLSSNQVPPKRNSWL